MRKELQEYLRSNDFTQFYRATSKEWEKMAKYLLRRWHCPPSVDIEDLIQELVMAVVTVLPSYDPKKGIPIERYVVWNACDRAKKWMHIQRNAWRRSDKSPPRFPISVSCMDGLESKEETLHPRQLRDIEILEAIEIIGKGNSKIYEALFTLIEKNMNKSAAVTALVNCGFLKFNKPEAVKLVEEVSNDLYRIIET